MAESRKPPRVGPPRAFEALDMSPEEYQEIVGSRPAPSEHRAGEILGELVTSGSLVARLEQNRPAVRPLAVKPRRVPKAFSVEGRAGEMRVIRHVAAARSFKPRDLHATDTSRTPGRATKITVFAGVRIQMQDVRTWMFAEWMDDAERAVAEDAVKLLGTPHEDDAVREAARRLRMVKAVREMTWDVWQGGLPIEIRVHFDLACRWDGVFWGDEIS